MNSKVISALRGKNPVNKLNKLSSKYYSHWYGKAIELYTYNTGKGGLDYFDAIRFLEQDLKILKNEKEYLLKFFDQFSHIKKYHDLLNNLYVTIERFEKEIYILKSDFQRGGYDPKTGKANEKLTKIRPDYITWNYSDESLLVFLNDLIDKGYIKNQKAETIVINHFKPTRNQDNIEPINWPKGALKLIANMLQALVYQGIIDADAGKFWQELTPHFKVKGKIKTPGQMASAAGKQLMKDDEDYVKNLIRKIKER